MAHRLGGPSTPDPATIEQAARVHSLPASPASAETIKKIAEIIKHGGTGVPSTATPVKK